MIFFSLLFAVLLHPVHETVSEVQWNDETDRLEVALRMSVLDQQWILRNHGGKEADVATWATNYLSRKVLVDRSNAADENPVVKNDSNTKNDSDTKNSGAKRPPRPRRTQYHWVGRKDEGAHVWWFFEIEPADGRKPSVLSQRMFFERDQGYTNRVLILPDTAVQANAVNAKDGKSNATGPRRSVTLTIQQPTAKLDGTADDKRATEQPRD